MKNIEMKEKRETAKDIDFLLASLKKEIETGEKKGTGVTLGKEFNQSREKLTTNNAKLQDERNKLLGESKKSHGGHEKLQGERSKLQIEYKKLEAEYNKLKIEYDKMKEKSDKIQAEHDKIKGDTVRKKAIAQELAKIGLEQIKNLIRQETIQTDQILILMKLNNLNKKNG